MDRRVYEASTGTSAIGIAAARPILACGSLSPSLEIRMSDAAPRKLVVIADLPCRRCRYPLRGQAFSARCPECGLAVKETIRSSIALRPITGADPGIAPTRRAAWSVPLLACGVGIAAAAGVLLPAMIVLTPGDLGPVGIGTRSRTSLPPVLMIGGAATLTAGVLALLATLVSHWRRQARREAIIAVSGAVLLLVAGGIATLPNGLGVGPAASGAARGLGAFFNRGGSGPNPSILVSLAFDGVRALGVAFLFGALGDLLRKIGRRSEAYARAGQGVQGSRPLVAATIMVLVTAAGWLASTVVGSRSGTWATVLDAVAWPILWLVAAGAIMLGGGYLAANAIWATAPWRRPHHQLEDFLGPDPRTSSPAASMADEDSTQRAP